MCDNYLKSNVWSIYFLDYSGFRQTANGVMESNIESSDNTATDVFRNSQMKSVRSLEDGINFAGKVSKICICRGN